ncbi:MAG TPA: TolC family protein, partial [Flavobacteriaceae bacterium]
TKVYQNLEEILQTALKNNPNIKVSALQTQQQLALKGTSFDLGKTEFGLDYGQTNSIADNDTRFSVSQSFAFPTLYSSQNKLAKTKIQVSELNEAVIKNELITQVTSTYYHLWHLKSKQKLLQKQDSIYVRFANAANLRYKTGESNALEQATANVELADVQILISDNNAALKNYQLQLQNLINADSLVDINVGNLVVKQAMFSENQEENAISKNPMVAYYNKRIELAENEKSVAVSKMLPDITLGYFNQSFIGNGDTVNGAPTVFDSGDRFTGIQLGLSIPLWFKPHTAKIKAAKIQKMESEAELEAVKNETQTQLKSLFQVLQKEQSNLESYKNNALPQAELLLKSSQRGFEEGEIGYVEYVQGLNRALSIQIKYLEFVNRYNQTLIRIEQLIANNL